MIAKRAWLYCRVENGWDWDSYEFMELQKSVLKSFCAEHGLTVTGISEISGKSIHQLRALVAEGIEKNTFDVLAATSSGRFSCNIEEIHPLAEQLAAQGKGLCMVQDNISTIQIRGFAPLNLEDMP